MLESLAHSNYLSPRPHPIDPAVFYDLIKIRKAVDEATNLAVRAASGLTSSALSSSLNASNGILGGAAALALGYGGTGSTSKMSRERKHRMRELATQKLSQAYHLDEVAASVATMQGTSTLEDVARLVLQRNNQDPDARYVHFFHEKIPSRMMAQCTPLDTLSEVIAERPTDGSLWRTRAVTRLFKDDYHGAVRDLTEALAQARYWQAQHRAGKDQLVLAKTFQEQHGRDWRQESKVEEEDQPNSLETQVLFHRAGAYLTIACQQIHNALNGATEARERARLRMDAAANGSLAVCEPSTASEETLAEKEANRNRLEAHKMVKTYAKRALRDYISFLSHFDYTPGLDAAIAQECMHHLKRNNGFKHSQEESSPPESPVTDFQDGSSSYLSRTSTALSKRYTDRDKDSVAWSRLPPPTIFQVSELFSSTPPASLPPFPASPCSLPPLPSISYGSLESVTYHPLLTDALHSLLLCHTLIQTSPKELLRHAHNAARIARVCDGYPVFLPARSPARADWIEILRRTGSWFGLGQSWEALCRPAPLPVQTANAANGDIPTTSVSNNVHSVKNQDEQRQRPETDSQRRERQKQKAILEAIADERVVDEDSFQRDIQAREQRLREDEEPERRRQQQQQSRNTKNYLDTGATTTLPTTPSFSQPKRWAQDDGKEYPVSTDRAEAISRWIKEAPAPIAGEGKNRKKAKNSKSKAKKEGRAVGMKRFREAMEVLSVQENNISDVEAEEDEEEEEEVD